MNWLVELLSTLEYAADRRGWIRVADFLTYLGDKAYRSKS